MPFIEDTVLTVKGAANRVVKETGRAVDISRLRLSASEINKEITSRYEALGKMIYDSRKLGTDVDGLIGECVKSIDALYSRYDSINAKIASLQNKRHCAICGAAVDKSAMYCSRCGSRLEKNGHSASGQEKKPEAEQEKPEE